MAFMLQILLSDVPTRETCTDRLLSFHYCTQCMYDGKMAWGYQDVEKRGYDVRIIESIQAIEPDGLGIVGEATLPTSAVTLSDYLEVPSVDEMPEALPTSWFLQLGQCLQEGVRIHFGSFFARSAVTSLHSLRDTWFESSTAPCSR